MLPDILRPKLWYAAALLLACLHVAECVAQKPDGYYLNAVNFVNANDFDQALGEINKVLELDPGHVQALYLRAFLYLKAGHKDLALADYNTVLEHMPGLDGALNNRSLLLMEKGKFDEAKADIEKRLAIKEAWPARYDLAYCLALMGKHREAIGEFTKVLDANPGYQPAITNKALSTINLHSNDGLTNAPADLIKGACADLRTAHAAGDSSLVKTLKKFCPEQ